MSDWFSKLSKVAQKAYIAKHPNSKYAKGGKKKAATKTPVKKTATKKPVNKVAENYKKIIAEAESKMKALKPKLDKLLKGRQGALKKGGPKALTKARAAYNAAAHEYNYQARVKSTYSKKLKDKRLTGR